MTYYSINLGQGRPAVPPRWPERPPLHTVKSRGLYPSQHQDTPVDPSTQTDQR